MTDRYNYLTVVLEKNLRSDDAADLIKAIGVLRGVLKVEPNVVSPDNWAAETRVRLELGEKLLAILFPNGKP